MRVGPAVFSGVKWSYFGSAVSALAVLAYTAVLARLLTPEQFGVMALAQLTLRFVTYFADAGTAASLIQRVDVEPADVETTAIISVAVGAILFGVLWLLAPAAGALLRDTTVVPVVRALGISLVVSSFGSASLAVLRREMRFGAIVAVEVLSSAVIYGLVCVALAALGFGVWSLVAGVIVSNLIASVSYFALVRHRIPGRFSLTSARSLLGYGGRFSLMTFLQFAGYASYPLITGAMLGSGALGVFTTARKLAIYVSDHLVLGITKVLFPSLSKVQSDDSRFRDGFQSAFFVSGLMIWPLGLFIASTARQIVFVVLGRGWETAVPVLGALAFATPMTYMAHMYGVTCDAKGLLRGKLLADATYVAVAVALCVLLLPRYGLKGVGAAYLVAEGLYLGWYLLLARESLATPLMTLLTDVMLLALVGLSVGLVSRGALLLFLHFGWPAGFALLGSAVLALLTWVVIVTRWKGGRIGGVVGGVMTRLGTGDYGRVGLSIADIYRTLSTTGTSTKVRVKP